MSKQDILSSKGADCSFVHLNCENFTQATTKAAHLILKFHTTVLWGKQQQLKNSQKIKEARS